MNSRSVAQYARVVIAGAGCLLLAMAPRAGVAASAPPSAGVPTPASVYVTVGDAAGRPVTNLTARDFVVNLGGQDQKVLSVARATDPVSLVLVVDAAVEDVSSVTAAFRAVVDVLKAIRPGSRVGVVSKRLPVTMESVLASSPAALTATVNAYSLLLGVGEAAKALEADASPRRVVLAVSRLAPQGEGFSTEEVAHALRQANASLWGIQITFIGANGMTPAERTMAMVTRMSGGTCTQVLNTISLDKAARDLTTLLASEYVLTFQPTPAQTAGELRIGVVRAEKASVYAPAWLPK